MSVENRIGSLAIEQPVQGAKSDTQPTHLLYEGQVALYNAHCLSILPQMPSNSVDCIWTDPPYLLSNDGVTCHAGRMVKVNKGEWDRSRGLEADFNFHRSWLSECYRILKPTGALWVSGTIHTYCSVGFVMQQLGFRILNDIVWEKPAPPPNLGCRCFTHSTEILLWATKAQKGKGRYTFHYEAMKDENNGKQMKNVWRFGAAGKSEKIYGKHPTQKPVSLVERCLRATTNPGDIVLDPFAGSSTTGVAAFRLNRNFVGIELEEEYVNLSMRRLEAESPA